MRLVLFYLFIWFKYNSGTSGNEFYGLDDEEFRKLDASQSHKLYYNEKYLRVMKSCHPNCDSKSIVDRATKKPLNQVLEALVSLDESNQDEIRKFVDEYLHKPGIEISKANLTDWKPYPTFLANVNSVQLKQFSVELNKIWLELYRKFDKEKLEPGCVSSHLNMVNPFIVPGGRFIEMYYWDTYWTIQGLLVCEMFDTVKMMLQNFVDFINRYGFIPNGSRVYYLNRSQPPYFSQMVMKLYEFSLKPFESLTPAKRQEIQDFVLNTALDSMIKEHEYWTRRKQVTVRKGDKEYVLNVYKAETKGPRPESYFEDTQSAQTIQDKEKFFADIATAAESGYDFSSRWFKDPTDFKTIQTTDIIPVDLNSILYRTECIIAELCSKRGDVERANEFSRRAEMRSAAINELLWLERKKCWGDYNMKTGEITFNFYISDLAPAWHGIHPPDGHNLKDTLSLYSYMLDSYEGGIPYSVISSGQQWDFPNTWAPYHESLISYLIKTNRAEALELARTFFRTVYTGWLKTGDIYEKYNAASPGIRGQGGEYEVQAGFGWTNGVTLFLISHFGDELITDSYNYEFKC